MRITKWHAARRNARVGEKNRKVFNDYKQQIQKNLATLKIQNIQKIEGTCSDPANKHKKCNAREGGHLAGHFDEAKSRTMNNL
jgi:hypothetical protein